MKWINPLSANPIKWSNTLKQFRLYVLLDDFSYSLEFLIEIFIYSLTYSFLIAELLQGTSGVQIQSEWHQEM